MTDSMAMADDLWRQRAQEGLARRAAQQAAEPIRTVRADKDPDPLKARLKSLDLLEVYRMWFGRGPERPVGGGNHCVSCFNTDFHPKGDRNPQLDIKVDEGFYTCHACGVRGDIMDLYAVRIGERGPDWRRIPDDTNNIVARLADELLGIPYVRRGKQLIPQVPENNFQPQTYAMNYAAAPVSAPPATGMRYVDVSVLWGARQDPETPLPPEIAEKLRSEAVPEENCSDLLPWREFVPPNTPLRAFMEAVCLDDSPEEYHFFNFLMLIGLLCGKSVVIADKYPVKGNLFLCMVGQTGVGKSNSLRHVFTIIGDTCPFKDLDRDSSGIKIISGAGSGEYMIAQFDVRYPNRLNGTGNDPKQKFPDEHHPGVRGLVKWGELSELIAKSSQKGATMSEKIIDLYDASSDIKFGSQTNGTTHAKNPFGSIVTTTQPKRIKKLLSRDQVDSGFLNRWVFVNGTMKERRIIGVPIDLDPVKPWVRKLIEWRTSLTRGQTEYMLQYTPAAMEELESFFKARLLPLMTTDEMYVRLDLLFKKLTLLMAANSFETAISVDSVRRAEQIITYIIKCYETFGASLVDDELDELHEGILYKIAEAGDDGVPVWKVVNSFKKKWGNENVKVAIRHLEVIERIVRKQPSVSGRVGSKKGQWLFIAE